jgi:multidrug efflux pump
VSAGIAEGIQADPLRQGIVAELEKADLDALPASAGSWRVR